ncbi:MAG TPA: hypothetical protein DHU96_30335 [Actinobacteria bacterium]|nr:hypothetical protein [Actinomycetota bacterium]
MSTISSGRLHAEVTGSSGTLAQLTGGADLTRPVPTCPAWTLRQLVTHVGRGRRMARLPGRTGARRGQLAVTAF